MQVVQRLAAVLMAATIASPAIGQVAELCTTESDGTFTPNFSVMPSLAVNADAVLDMTMSGLGGEGEGGAFSFSRTIARVLESAGADAGPEAQAAFVQTLLDSVQPPTPFALNTQAGVQMPFDQRQEQSLLSAEAMLDENSAQAMRPLALFNRFDLAPDNWSHCGEHRIVYGKFDPDNPTFERFLLIFEAMVPNPGTGREGCRPIVEFWANLSQGELDDTEMASRLSAFYYEGKTSPDLEEPDLLSPVVDYRNYGGDGGRGQVRGNLFMQQPWQLREWLTQRTFNPEEADLVFAPVTVKDNPLAELYRDDLAGTDVMANNIPAAVNLLHGQFVQALTSTIGTRLLSEGTDKHRQLVDEFEAYNLGTGPQAEVTENTILLNTIGLGNDDKFNEFQSTSQGQDDIPGEPLGQSLIVRGLLDQLGGVPMPEVNQQSGEIILNRARAVTCAGCHMTAARSQGFGGPGIPVLKRPDGSELLWPDVDQGGFVHVSEETRALSPALTDHFLPFRRYVMARYLCGLQAEPGDGDDDGDVGVYTPGPEMPTEAAVARTAGPELVDELGSGSRFVESLVRDFATQAGVTGTTEAVSAAETVTSDQIGTIIGQLSPAELLALRQRVNEAINLARDIELQRPGAFVETRRPH